jgi:hypothetical protein
MLTAGLNTAKYAMLPTGGGIREETWAQPVATARAVDLLAVVLLVTPVPELL